MTLKSAHFHVLLISIVGLWVFLVVFEQRADVWDETDLLLNNLKAPSTGALLRYLWTHSIYFYRPLGASIMGLASRLLDYESAWRLLRFLNAAMLLAGLSALVMTMRRWNGIDRTRDLLVIILFLFSGSAFITAGWFPVIFDAGVLLLLAAALLAVAHDLPVIAGFLIGIAFLFKENAAIGIPLLFGLWLMERIDKRTLIKSLLVMMPIAGFYWIQRSTLIPLGSGQDIHGFQLEKLIPTAAGWFQSFWYQSIDHLGLPGFGAVWLLVSLALLKGRKAQFAAFLLVIAPVLLYWGMFDRHRNHLLVTAAHFQGRFYLVPASLLLFWLALWGRRVALVLLVFPVLLGATHTYIDHLKFQAAYTQIYELKRSTPALTVHYPEKPLNDWRRDIRIGDYPTAPFRLDPATGAIVRRSH